MIVYKGGSWRSSASALAYINGAWRQIAYGECYKGGSWRKVVNYTASPTPSPTPTPTGTMTVSLSPSSVTGLSPTSPVYSSSITATPSGGRSPYTYAWSIVTSDGHAFTIGSPANATTTVSSNNITQGTTATCTVRCRASDSTGLTATSASAPVTLTYREPLDIDRGSRL